MTRHWRLTHITGDTFHLDCQGAPEALGTKDMCLKHIKINASAGDTVGLECAVCTNMPLAVIATGFAMGIYCLRCRQEMKW